MPDELLIKQNQRNQLDLTQVMEEWWSDEERKGRGYKTL